MYPIETKLLTFFEVENQDELKKLDFPEETELILSEYIAKDLVKEFYTLQLLKTSLS
jgi:hypothetical protein